MGARHPTTIQLSLPTLAQRGGAVGPHRDGWGVAYVMGHDALVLKEPAPASSSNLARFVGNADFSTSMAIAHIRLATHGEKTLANTQPFARELQGRTHAFAHNGHLPSVFEAFTPKRFRPIGTTDSEQAFCELLDRLVPLWTDVEPPPLPLRIEAVAAFAHRLREHGVANFIYCDTDALFLHGHRRPKEQDNDPTVPGLYVLQRQCGVDRDSTRATTSEASPTERPLGGEPEAARLPPRGTLAKGSLESRQNDSGVVLHTPEAQHVTLAATVPLTSEAWRPLEPGELLVVHDGAVIDACYASRLRSRYTYASTSATAL